MVQYYAKVTEGVVTDIQVIADALVEAEGEQAGSDLLTDLFGGEWVRFSKTGEFRFNRAGRGSLYDAEADAFHAPQPFPSWTLTDEFKWEAPIPYPNDGLVYSWDEESGDWVEVVEPSA